MTTNLDQPDLGISDAFYFSLLLNNKKLTRNSAKAGSNVPPQAQQSSDQHNQNVQQVNSHLTVKTEKKITSKRKENSETSEQVEASAIQENQNTINKKYIRLRKTSKKIKTSNDTSKEMNQPPKDDNSNDICKSKQIPKKELLPEVNIDYPRTFKILDIENSHHYIPFRNELALGLNCLYNRKVKVITRTDMKRTWNIANAILDNTDLMNVEVCKINPRIDIVYKYPEGKNEIEWPTNINMNNVDNSQFDVLLCQNVCVVDITQEDFNRFTQNKIFDGDKLSYQMVTKGKNHIWPVVILNPIAGNTPTWISNNLISALSKSTDDEAILNEYSKGVRIDELEKELEDNDDIFDADKGNISSSNFESILHTPEKQSPLKTSSEKQEIKVKVMTTLDVIKIDSDCDSIINQATQNNNNNTNTNTKTNIIQTEQSLLQPISTTTTFPILIPGKRPELDERLNEMKSKIFGNDRFSDGFDDDDDEMEISSDSNFEELLKRDSSRDKEITIEDDNNKEPGNKAYDTAAMELETIKKDIQSFRTSSNVDADYTKKLDKEVLIEKILTNRDSQPESLMPSYPYEQVRSTRNRSIVLDNLQFDNAFSVKKIVSARIQKIEQLERLQEEIKEYSIVWYVGTNYYEIRNSRELKPLNKDARCHLIELSKKSDLLNRIMTLTSEYIKAYNQSIKEIEPAQLLTLKLAKESLSRLVWITGEDKTYHLSIPLQIKEKDNGDNQLWLRDLKNLSIRVISMNEKAIQMKPCPWIPKLTTQQIENIDYEECIKDYDMNYFLRDYLLNDLYPGGLLTSQSRYLKQQLDDISTKYLKDNQKEILNKKAILRCKLCKYILGDLEYYKCVKCEEYYHEQCLHNKKKNNGFNLGTFSKNKQQSGKELKHDDWACLNCRGCSYCLSIKNRESLLQCNHCEHAYHTFCLRFVYKTAKLSADIQQDKFLCQECAKCNMCKKELFNFSEKNIDETGQTLCEDCNLSKARKEFCPLCNRKWDYSAQAQNKEENDMIECACKMWVHRMCDPELTKDLFKEFAATGRVYHCPRCREINKNKQIIEFINILADLDEHKFFAKPVDVNVVLNYRNVIDQPMDFETMLEKANEGRYLDDPINLLMKDFELICNNAMIYNMPKSNIFIQAKKLKKFGEKAFLFFKDILACTTTEFLKYSRKLMPAYSLSAFKKEIEEYYYDILFEEADTNPNTRIRLVETSKNQPVKKHQMNKEIVIEITGLNHLIVEKSTRDERKQYSGTNKLGGKECNPNDLKTAILSLPGASNDSMNKEQLMEQNQANNVMEIESQVAGNENLGGYECSKKLLTPGPLIKTFKEGIQIIEDFLIQNIRNKPFFYFTPVIIQFSNPILITYDACYLCGSYGNVEDLIICATCQEAYHYFCISKAYADVEKFNRIKNMVDWNCPKCKQCQKCHKKSETHDCIICEQCDNLYHVNCIYPQVRILFPSYWKCENCFRCGNCGRNKIFSENLSLENNVIYHEFCEDFKWCYECGLKLAYFKFCKICKKYCQKSISSKNPLDKKRSLQYINPQEDSIECTECSFKYHISCYQEEFYPIKDYNNFVCYNCQIIDNDPQKMEEEIISKIKDIQNRKKNIRKLMTISESIFTHYSIAKIELNARENFYKFLASFVLEEYENLMKFPHVKCMLQNFELLNEATRLIVPKPNNNKALNTIINSTDKSDKLHSAGLPSGISSGYSNDLTTIINEDYIFNPGFMFNGLGNHLEHASMAYPHLDEMLQGDTMSNLEHICNVVNTYRLMNQIQDIPSELTNQYMPLVHYLKIGRITIPNHHEIIFPILANNEDEDNDDGNGHDDISLFSTSFINDIFLMNMHPSPYAKCLSNGILRQEKTKSWIRRRILNSKSLLPLGLIDYMSNTTTPIQPQSKDILTPMQLMLPTQGFSQFKLYTRSNSAYSSILVHDYTHDQYQDHDHDLQKPSEEPMSMEIEEPSRDSCLGSMMPVLSVAFTDQFLWLTQHLDSFIKEIKLIPPLIEQPTEVLVSNPVIIRKESPQKDSMKKYEEIINLMKNELLSIETIKQRLIERFNEIKDQFARNKLTIPLRALPKPQLTNDNTKPSISAATNNTMDIIPESSTRPHPSLNHDLDSLSQSTQDDNPLIPGPLSWAECVCCKLQGDRKLNGRLLFVECDQWVHANCALWSYDVYEDIEGGLVNFLISHKRAMTTICTFCEKSGASIFCFSKKCQNKYHFHCAVSANCAFLISKKFYCKSCSMTKTLNHKVNTDFTTNRRLYIVRNQTLFHMENTKNSKYIKEKPLELQTNAFTRLGSLTIISAKKLNSDIAFLLSEYTVIRLFNKPNSIKGSIERRALMLNLQLTEGSYTYRLSKIDQSSLANRTHLFLQKNINNLLKATTETSNTNGGAGGSASGGANSGGAGGSANGAGANGNGVSQCYVLDSAETFYDRIMLYATDGLLTLSSSTTSSIGNNMISASSSSVCYHEQDGRIRDRERIGMLDREGIMVMSRKNSVDSVANHMSKVNKKELLGEFLGLYNPDVKKWIKTSLVLNESEEVLSREHPSFQEYFYSENIEDLNAFERMERIQTIYEPLSTKLNNLIETFKSTTGNDKLKNPRDRSFSKSSKLLKTNRRKEITNQVDFTTEEFTNENSLTTALDNPKYNKILNEELENKLRIEYRKHKEGPSKVFVAPSPIHKYGLFAVSNFNKNEIVIEYCGEVIRNKIADLREAKYKQAGFGDCFMFRIEKDSVVDASFKGNQARFLNHSCDPNCSSIILEVDKAPKIIVYANRPIYAGEELTYDYQFDIETEKIECHCQAKKCLGRLN